MISGFELKGADAFVRKLKDLQERAKALDRIDSIPYGELFTHDFMTECTEFESMDAMFQKCGFSIKSPEDIARARSEGLDACIQRNSRFSDWEKMFEAAYRAWLRRKLEL